MDYRRGLERKRGVLTWQQLWHFSELCEDYPTRDFVVRKDDAAKQRALQALRRTAPSDSLGLPIQRTSERPGSPRKRRRESY